MRNPSARIAQQQSARLAQQQIPSDGENSDGEDELIGLDNGQLQPAKRGHTRMKKIRDLPSGKRLDVSVNRFNQFCCQDATTFANYLGSLVRNGEEVPLTYMNWRHVPLPTKNRLWELVKLKWNVLDGYKDQAMKSFGKKLREFRYNLKKDHYDKHESYDARIADMDSRVKPDQWRFLVDYWDSEEFLEKSEKNKANRAKQTTTHCAGSKSYARFAKELHTEYDRSPTRAEVFSITHCDKKGRPMNPETAEVLGKMDELCRDQPELAHKGIADGDLYGKVFGKEKNGCLRGVGLGPTPSDIWGDGSNRAKSLRMAEEAREAQRKAEDAQQEAEEAKRKMEEERQADREQNLTIMARLAVMQEKIDELEKGKHVMQEKIDTLEKGKHVDAYQNNLPHVPIADEREFNYNQNDNNDSASSAASHQMQSHNGSVRNMAKKRTYNMDPKTIQTQKELSNKDIRRIKLQKSAPNMVDKRDRPIVAKQADNRDRHVAKQHVNRSKTTTLDVQDTSKYIMCSFARNRPVAEGFILSKRPQDEVGGQKLGPHYVELFVDKVIAPEEPLVRPYGKYECLKDVAGSVTAWPKSLLKKV